MALTSTGRFSSDDFNAYAVSNDRVATFAGQPQSETSLTRTIEAAALLPDHTMSETVFSVPATPTFEACATAFARGTLISTVMGPIAVEDLIPGDLVQTHRGPEPIVWKGSTNYVPRFPSNTTSLTHLLRLTGNGMNQNDLLLGPAARLVIRQERFSKLLNCDAVLAPASDYVDGDRILKITPPSPVQLFHFALRRHGIVRANGHELESYHPGRVSTADVGAAVRTKLQSMFSHLRDLEGFGDLAFPRTTRTVIDTLRVA
jgi:hypothetical protein